MENSKLNSYACHSCGIRPGCFLIPHHFAWGLEEQPRVCEVCIELDSSELTTNLCQNIGGFVILTQRRSLASELFRLRTGRA